MARQSLAALAATILMVSCTGRVTEHVLTRQLPKVQVPALITDRNEVASYVAMHWWDSLVDTSGTYITDSTVIAGVPRSEIEQSLANYSAVLESLPVPIMRKSVETFYGKLSQMEAHDRADSTFEAMVRIFDRYLYDPNSPVRNEEIYLPFCEKLAQSDYLSEAERDIYAHNAAQCSLNRIGTPAADFLFSDRYGKVRSLYSIKAPVTLLFFSNPGCHACKDIIDNLTTIPEISSMVTSGQLAVVNIYIDEDLTAWYEYMPIYPSEWYNGYDPNLVIRNDELYSVRAIPSLYILDEAKNVIMKDVPEPKAFDFLSSLVSR